MVNFFGDIIIAIAYVGLGMFFWSKIRPLRRELAEEKEELAKREVVPRVFPDTQFSADPPSPTTPTTISALLYKATKVEEQVIERAVREVVMTRTEFMEYSGQVTEREGTHLDLGRERQSHFRVGEPGTLWSTLVETKLNDDSIMAILGFQVARGDTVRALAARIEVGLERVSYVPLMRLYWSSEGYGYLETPVIILPRQLLAIEVASQPGGDCIVIPITRVWERRGRSLT